MSLDRRLRDELSLIPADLHVNLDDALRQVVTGATRRRYVQKALGGVTLVLVAVVAFSAFRSLESNRVETVTDPPPSQKEHLEPQPDGTLNEGTGLTGPSIGLGRSQTGSTPVKAGRPSGAVSGSGSGGGPSLSGQDVAGPYRLAFVSTRNGGTNIFVMNEDGSGQTNVTNNTAVNTSPDWSPEGSRLAFASGGRPDHDSSQIYLMDADGANQSRLTSFNPGGVVRVRPTWAPDRTRIAVTSGGRYQGCEAFGDCAYVRTFNPDGSDERILTSGWAQRYSPDARRMALLDLGGSHEAATCDGTFVPTCAGMVYILDLETMQRRELGVYANSLAWSPDGGRIALGYSPTPVSNTVRIAVMNEDGSGLQMLTAEGTVDTQPAWSPDGRRIAFATSRHGNYEIYVMDATGQNQRRITNVSGTDSLPAYAPRR